MPQDVTSGPGWSWDPRGWLRVYVAGAVLEDLEVNGNVDVTVSNVVMRRLRIVQGGDTFGISLRHARNVSIEYCDIRGIDDAAGRLMVGIKDIYGDSQGIRVVRNDISNVSTAIQMSSGIIEGNYIHDLGYRSGDHVNGTTDNGGSTDPLIIRGNTVFNEHPQTDAISLFQDFGGQSDRLIEGNLIAGGGYTVYGGANPGGAPTTRIRIIGNRFSRHLFPNGGHYGPVTAFDPAGEGNVFEDNVWDDSLLPVEL